MNDNYDIEKGLVFRKATGQYYKESTFVDIQLTPHTEWKTKFKNIRDVLFEGTTPSSASITPQKSRCDNCMIS
jgi:accessory colonization factor AcfC